MPRKNEPLDYRSPYDRPVRRPTPGAVRRSRGIFYILYLTIVPLLILLLLFYIRHLLGQFMPY